MDQKDYEQAFKKLCSITAKQAESILCGVIEGGYTCLWLNDVIEYDNAERSTCNVVREDDGCYKSICWVQLEPDNDEHMHNYMINVDMIRERYAEYVCWLLVTGHKRNHDVDQWDAEDYDCMFQWLAFGDYIYG